MSRKRPRLTVEQILAWAEAHHARTGDWPGVACGPVCEAPGESWPALDKALHDGWRGLPGGDSLARLLVRRGCRTGLWAGPTAWTAAEDDLLRRLPPAEVARRTGRTLVAVFARRSRLRLPDGRRRYR
jgi:hypothetical protein